MRKNLAGLFTVVMIVLSAVLAGVESVRRLADPQPLNNLGWVLAAGVIGFAGNEIVAMYRIRVGRRIGLAALVADGIHARTDGFTSLAVVLGVVGVWAGFPLADPVIGPVITAAIFVLLWGTARDVGRRLLDGVDPELTIRTRDALGQVEESMISTGFVCAGLGIGSRCRPASKSTLRSESTTRGTSWPPQPTRFAMPYRVLRTSKSTASPGAWRHRVERCPW